MSSKDVENGKTEPEVNTVAVGIPKTEKPETESDKIGGSKEEPVSQKEAANQDKDLKKANS